MPISKDKKREIVEKLKKALKGAKSLVFVNFRGLSVGNTTNLRRVLKESGISYTVAKKTLTRKVLNEENLKGSAPVLDGELALAWGEDLVAPAREVYAFQKKFPENLKIVGGIFEGRYMSQLEMEAMALIPSINVLRGKFVNIINSPIQRLVVGLNEISKIK